MSSKRVRILFRCLLGAVTALLIVGFAVGPSIVERRLNPRSSFLLEPVEAYARSLHQAIAVVDLHADSLLWGRNLSNRSDNGYVDIPRLIDGNVALQNFTVVTKVPNPLKLENNKDDTDDITKLAILQRWPIQSWISLKQRAIHQAKELHKVARRSSGKFTIIKTQTDLNNYLDRRQADPQITAGLLGLEGAQVLEGKLENVDRLYRAGFRTIGLSHFFDNEVSGSAHGISGSGLTPFGREVIARIEDLGMIVDLAHASAQTIDDVLAMARRPVIVSHTGVSGTCNNARNLSDYQLQQIAATGGIVGIGFWSTAVCGTDVKSIAQAIRYAADLIGVDRVSLGSDFDGAVQLPFDAANLDQMTQGLMSEGFSDAEIEKIMGLNAIRLLQQTLPQ